jgi:FdhD protein
VCGKATIENAVATAPPLACDTRFPAAFLTALPERLRREQRVFAATGGLHAAALFDARGEILVVREDVGRHNAVDKAIGWAARSGRFPLGGHGLLVSGRASFEITQKALAARIPLVAAVSAPSSLAVQLASAANLALVGFLRGSRFNVYGARWRVA